jgi:hypothetical protein
MRFRIVKKRFYRLNGEFESYYIQVEKKRFFRKSKFIFSDIEGVNDGNLRTIEDVKKALLYIIIDNETLEDRIIYDINEL